MEYDRAIRNDLLRASCFSVEDHFETAVYPSSAVHTNGGVVISPRRIRRVYANSVPEPASKGEDGFYVILELDPDDRAAPSLYLIGEHRNCRSFMKKLHLLAFQTGSITALDGTAIPPQAGVYNSSVYNRIADDFIYDEFEGLSYSLYIPKDYDGSRSYPLLQFIADSWDVGPDPATSLAQGWGGVVWAFPEEQRKRPCFVLCPHFPGPTIIEDDYSTRPELETAIRLMDYILKTYNIDRNRVYHTGQSMGAMTGFQWAARYPDTFATLLLMSGSGDPKKIGRLRGKPIWLLASEADGRGTAILNQTADTLEQTGSCVGRYRLDGRLNHDELNHCIRTAAMDENNMRFTLFNENSVVPADMLAEGGANHRGVWLLCYQLESLREWLFAQKRNLSNTDA